MCSPRLLFLYPHLFKTVRALEPCALRPLPTSTSRPRKFHTPTRRRQESYAQRYVPAAEPPLPPSMPLSRDVKKETNPASTSKASERQGNDTAGKGSAQPPMEQKKDPASTREAPPPRAKEREKTPRSAEMDAAESHPKEPADGPIREGPRQPLETVLLMERPSSEEHKHLHLHAPPYVHHFDTFTLVKDLEKGGFTQDQSVTLMKAVRSLLAVNLDVAKDGLISKSDVENVRSASINFLSARPRHIYYSTESKEPANIVTPHLHRKRTSSAPPAPNFARRSKTPVKAPTKRCAPSAPTCNTKSRS